MGQAVIRAQAQWRMIAAGKHRVEFQKQEVIRKRVLVIQVNALGSTYLGRDVTHPQLAKEKKIQVIDFNVEFFYSLD
jgi:hypothetical protein